MAPQLAGVLAHEAMGHPCEADLVLGGAVTGDLGVSLTAVGRTLETMMGSRIVTTFLERGEEYNVILQGRDEARETTTDLTNIRVRSARTSELIPLAHPIALSRVVGAPP